MRTKEDDTFPSEVEPIKPPRPHKLRRLRDPRPFRNLPESRREHHLKPWFAYQIGAIDKARRP